MIVLVKKILIIATAELIRVREGDNFIQGIVLVNRTGVH